VLVVKGNQKIEHFFLPLGECHGTLLRCAPMLGESKAKNKKILETLEPLMNTDKHGYSRD
jgi:hypothetical protein